MACSGEKCVRSSVFWSDIMFEHGIHWRGIRVYPICIIQQCLSRSLRLQRQIFSVVVMYALPYWNDDFMMSEYALQIRETQANIFKWRAHLSFLTTINFWSHSPEQNRKHSQKWLFYKSWENWLSMVWGV